MMEEDRAIDIASRRAEDWFKIHAEQRLTLFNFYITLLAASLAGFATTAAAGAGQPILIAAISITVLVVTYAFKQLDARVSKLIKDAEAALCRIDEMVSLKLEIEEVRLAEIAEQKNGTKSYRESFGAIFGFGTLLGLTGLVAAIWIAGISQVAR